VRFSERMKQLAAVFGSRITGSGEKIQGGSYECVGVKELVDETWLVIV